MADEIELLRLVGELVPEPTPGAWARAEAAVAAARAADPPRQDTRRPAGNRPRSPALRVARRRGLSLLAAAGVAAAVAVGVVAQPGGRTTPGTRPSGTSGPDITVAYVVQRVDGALSAAEPGEIAQLTVTNAGPAAVPGSKTTTEEWSYGDRWRSVTYSSPGHVLFDAGFSPTSAFTLVNYRAGTWARESGMGRPASLVPGPRSCGPAVAALSWLFQPGPTGLGFAGSSLPATAASALRAAIACGALTDAGRQRVDGTEAIALTSPPGSLIAVTIWVSPDTYLPVRVALRPPPGAPAPQRTADITWLQPTAANLARLAVPVPAGFRQVPLAVAGTIVP